MTQTSTTADTTGATAGAAPVSRGQGLDSVPVIDQEQAVARRYSAGAQQVEAALCCPVDHDPRFLAAIPAPVLERDYGCGGPSRYLDAGETVLDLGSGTGKICFIASQVVGPGGRVIGVDVNDDMLAVAYEGKHGECLDHGQAVIYPGPFKAVLDDDGHVLERGVPAAVCAKTFQLYAQAPYAGLMQLLEPARPVDPATTPLLACIPPAALTGNPAVSTSPAVRTARRDLAGRTGHGGDPAAACC